MADGTATSTQWYESVMVYEYLELFISYTIIRMPYNLMMLQ
jgi:hypothetical protein